MLYWVFELIEGKYDIERIVVCEWEIYRLWIFVR